MTGNICKQVVLEENIDYILEEILKNISNVESVLLCGSYGREEGAWVEDGDGQYIPYNDLDFIVVSDKPDIVREDLNQLRRRLATELKINWVDIDIYSTRKISKLKATQKNIDITFGNKQIYGEKIKWNLGESDIVRLGKSDIETLYFTRLWTFLSTYPYKNCTEIAGSDAIFFRYQMAKAVLACVDVILIKEHMYHYSYTERVRRVKEIVAFKKWDSLFEWALEQKLGPEQSQLSKEVICEIYDKVMNLYYEVMKYGLDVYYKIYEHKYFFEICYEMQLTHLIIFIYHILRGDYNWHIKYRKALSLQNSIFIDLCKNERINKGHYEKILKRYFNLDTDYTIESIVEAISVARNSL